MTSIAEALEEIQKASAAERSAVPAAVEIVGSALAEQLKAKDATAVVVRDDIDDAVLAHVVGRELGVDIIRVYEEEGLLTLAPEPAPGTRAVLLANHWDAPARLQALRLLLAHHQTSLVAVAALVSSDALAALSDVDTVVA